MSGPVTGHFNTLFPNETACREFLEQRRWPGGVRCPRCKSRKVYKLFSGVHWQCHACSEKGYRFSALVGTPFEDTRVPLNVWFRIVCALVNRRRNKPTILELHEFLGLGSYRTTWRLYHRIAELLKSKRFLNLMGIDEGSYGLWWVYEPPQAGVVQGKERGQSKRIVESGYATLSPSGQAFVVLPRHFESLVDIRYSCKGRYLDMPNLRLFKQVIVRWCFL